MIDTKDHQITSLGTELCDLYLQNTESYLFGGAKKPASHLELLGRAYLHKV